MILEQALLPVKPGSEEAFLEAFGTAQSIIASMPGFEGLTLFRCLERPSTFLLLVEWARVEDHSVGFRSSAGYQEWRRLLHHFYDPIPTVEHFEPLFVI